MRSFKSKPRTKKRDNDSNCNIVIPEKPTRITNQSQRF